jgi:hypothetical protein
VDVQRVGEYTGEDLVASERWRNEDNSDDESSVNDGVDYT